MCIPQSFVVKSLVVFIIKVCGGKFEVTITVVFEVSIKKTLVFMLKVVWGPNLSLQLRGFLNIFLCPPYIFE